jgi:DNA polymerase I-like protein with 3'-5' exonuclease and polymerase domains
MPRAASRAFCAVVSESNDNMTNIDQFRALVATCTTDELVVALLDPITASKVKTALAKAAAAHQDQLQAVTAKLDGDIERVAAAMPAQAMIEVTVQSDSDAGAKQLTVDSAQSVHEAISEAFGCKSQQQVQRVLFGDTDVLKGESFEDHGVEVSGVTHLRRTVQCPLSIYLAP